MLVSCSALKIAVSRHIFVIIRGYNPKYGASVLRSGKYVKIKQINEIRRSEFRNGRTNCEMSVDRNILGFNI
jgi:hypothetical protein